MHQLEGVCAPFGRRVLGMWISRIYICIGFTLPTIREYVSVGGCLCALRARAWGMCIFKNIHLCYFSVKNLPLWNFFMLFHLRSGPQFAGAQSAMGQFAGGQYAGETANWALESEGPNLPGLRFVLSYYSINPVNDTSQWQIYSHFCHWPAINDKYACIFVIDRSQWQICVHICHWLLVNDKNARIFVIDLCHWLGLYYIGICHTGSTFSVTISLENNHFQERAPDVTDVPL